MASSSPTTEDLSAAKEAEALLAWPTIDPQPHLSVGTKLPDPFAMTNQTSSTAVTALESVYNANAADARNLNNLASNAYYNNAATNAYAAPSTYMYNPQQYYQMAAAANLRTPSFANYIAAGSAAAAAAVHPYYSAGLTAAAANTYGNTAMAAAASGFDYTAYNASNNYYNGTGRNSASGYYSTGLPYTGLGLSTAGDSTTPSTSGSLASSAYPGVIKTEHKANRKSKKKKLMSGIASPEPNYARIFVWELEDLCMMLSNIYNRSGPQFILEKILRQGFQMTNVEECEQTNIEDANMDDPVQELCYGGNQDAENNSPELKSVSDPQQQQQRAEMSPTSTASRSSMGDMRRIAMRYQRIKDVYNQCKDNQNELIAISELMPIGTAEQLADIVKQADSYGTLERYRRCLRIAMERCSPAERYTNIVISSEPLASTFAKLLFVDFAAFVPVENVYSSHKVGRVEVIDRIVQRFKKNMIIVSSNMETRELASKENIPFWRINGPKDVEAFYIALDKVLLSGP